MEKLYFPGTKHTPDVLLETGKIKLTGRSVPADPELFFKPIYNWVESYVNRGLTDTILELDFEYINTASTKWVFNLLKLLGSDGSASEKLKVTWCYENGDDDMYDLGLIFQSLVPTKFKFIETPENR